MSNFTIYHNPRCSKSRKTLELLKENGIDPEIVYQRSLEKEMISKEDSQDYTDQEKLNLIMLPGFSTKQQATEYSGRGVGMDVVNTNVKNLGGKVELESVIGKGTTFKIVIPQIS